MATYTTEMDIDQDSIYGLIVDVYARRPGQASDQAYVPPSRSGLQPEDDLYEFFDLELYYSEAGPPDSNQPTPHNMSDVPQLIDNDAGSSAETSSIGTPKSVTSHRESPLIDDGFLERPSPSSAFGEFKSHQDPHIFPDLRHKPAPPIQKVLHISSAPGSASKKRPRSPSPPRARRAVKNVDKTNQVRASKSCTKCRIQKIECTVEGICETCTKAYPKAPECACFRRDLSSTASGSSHQRWFGLNRTPESRAKYSIETTCDFLPPLYKGTVVFPGHPGVRLPVTLQNYVCMSKDRKQTSFRGCVIARGVHNGVPQHAQLISWAEAVVTEEDSRTFEGAVENFVKIYSEPCRSQYSHHQARPMARMTLLNRVHTMKCMYKICREDNFDFIRDAPAPADAARPLPLPAQAELRTIARKALESAERDVLLELDKLLRPGSVGAAERPALWAALWQLMFVYRGLLRDTGRRLLPNSDADAEGLLGALAVFYAAHFRTSASLRLSMDGVGVGVGCETRASGLEGAFEHALSLRGTHLQSIAAGVDDIDQRLKLLVVDPEMKVLNRRQPKK